MAKAKSFLTAEHRAEFTRRKQVLTATLGRPLIDAKLQQLERDVVEDGENPLPFDELVAENMAIYAGVMDDALFLEEARRLLSLFEAKVGRPPRDYSEFEQWAHMQTGPACRRFFVV